MSDKIKQVIEHHLAKAIVSGALPESSWKAWKTVGTLSTHDANVLLKAKDMTGDLVDSSMMISELESIAKDVDIILKSIKEKDVAPDWAKGHVTTAAEKLASVARFIAGVKS
jgi:uncharacterized hydantoinase/oxoprolinase family protein